VKRDGLALSAGVTLPLNAELQVGAVEDTITVSGLTPARTLPGARGDGHGHPAGRLAPAPAHHR
jgi:hypothetical protein